MKIGFNNIDNEDYHADTEFLSSSSLKLMNKCPREFYKRYIKGEEVENLSSAAMQFGTLVHSIILEPDLFDTEYAVYEGGVKRGKEYEAFKEVNQDKIIISQSQLSKATLLKDVTEENKHAMSLLKGGTPEQTLCVELDGVKIKVRTDYLQGNKIVDVKTTGTGVSYEEVQGAIMKWDYALSAALYSDAFTTFTGEKHDFYFVFLGKSPMGCEVYKASESMLEHGRKKYKAALEKIKHAKETGIWFNEGIMEISLPEMM